MKINIGDYVKFDEVINKIEDIDDGVIEFEIPFYDDYNDYVYHINYEKFIETFNPKSSPNIIDLIEAGDLLHSKIDNQWWQVEENIANDGCIYTEWLVIENEKQLLEKVDAIITKEQMGNRSYKVGE